MASFDKHFVQVCQNYQLDMGFNEPVFECVIPSHGRSTRLNSAPDDMLRVGRARPYLVDIVRQEPDEGQDFCRGKVFLGSDSKAEERTDGFIRKLRQTLKVRYQSVLQQRVNGTHL